MAEGAPQAAYVAAPTALKVFGQLRWIPRGMPCPVPVVSWGVTKHINRSHNVSVLLYHRVCPAKYRRAVFSADVDTALRGICLENATRYNITFLEIGTDRNGVHFLMPTILAYSPNKLTQIIKSLTARGVFRGVPTVKKSLWGGKFWSDGTYLSTVRQHSAKARSGATSPTNGAKKSTPGSIRNSSAYSEKTWRVPCIPRGLLRGSSYPATS
jgi:putative transposase